MYKKLILITLTIAFAIPIVYTQSQYDFNCDLTVNNLPTTPLGMGLAKPMKTPPANDINKYLRVLMIFVEFANDNTGSTYYWSPGQLPNYANELFAPQKQFGLTAYENYKMSDYFNKVSRDEFDVLGDVYHVTLSNEYSYYSGFNQTQTEVFTILDNDPNFDWGRYDLWSWNENLQEYEQNPDDYIDMIYVQYRRIDPFGVGWGGAGSTLADYTTSTYKYISSMAINYLGSGVTGVDGSDMSRDAVVGLFRHEYCHYSLGNHKPYCTVAGQDGTNMALGYEVGFSPMDMIAVGYDNSINFNPNTESYSIGDLHSTGDLIKIPTGISNEYFLISNRRRIVGDGSGLIYDCNMAGDTAMGTPFLQFKDYSKGLYIYHVSNMDGFSFWADLECADGLWDWEYSHNTTPDWSSSQQLPVLLKSAVSYSEDDPYTGFTSSYRMTGRDGHSVVNQNYGGAGYHTKWFSIGKRHENLGQQGIDRIFTNLNEDWCSRECFGDRWDAWVVGYNQIFSSYSSPNTKDRSGNNTGIFLYYENQNSNTANLKIYRTGYGGYNESQILTATPPSRPMGLELSFSACENGVANPILTWNHNMEPDMIVSSILGDYKIYKIYRVDTENLNELPDENNYELIATVQIGVNDVPTYRDYNTQLECDPGGEPEINYAVRYRVTAVDITSWESVKSDFTSNLVSKVYHENFILPVNTPKVFSLSQNYPNPFNPSTEIKYSIPSNGFVILKVYNLLGEEIANLVGEYKEAGEYTATFDGSNLASGVYFYKLGIGAYTAVKKMVLIK